jgi:hypothetical protein
MIDSCDEGGGGGGELSGSTTRKNLYLGIMFGHNRTEKSLYSAVHTV